jgi:hypothetical protein
MIEEIRNQITDINNQVNFGMSYSLGSTNRDKFYYVDVINYKKEAQRFYLDKSEYSDLMAIKSQQINFTPKKRSYRRKAKPTV